MGGLGGDGNGWSKEFTPKIFLKRGLSKIERWALATGEVITCVYLNRHQLCASMNATELFLVRFRFITALVYLNYRLMMNGAARGYVHSGSAFLQKKLFSVVRGARYKGVRWFIDAVMQIKAARCSRTRPTSAQTSIFLRGSVSKRENKEKRGGFYQSGLQRVNLLQVNRGDYQSQGCQCCQWRGRKPPHSLARAMRKTTAAAIKLP